MAGMWSLLLTFSILQLSHCSCPSGFDLVDNECRGLYVQMPSIRWVDAPATAISKCQEILSQPVIIHNADQQSYWAKKMNVANNPVIGLLCNTDTKQWEWADGSALNYKPPNSNAALDSTCTTGFSWYIDSYGSWLGSGNYTHLFPVDIFCSSQLRQPVPSDDGCNGFEDDGDDGVCYQVGEAAENWQDAQLICRKFGANLASIHSLQENSFVRRLAVSKGAVNGLFLGATMSGKGNEFGWVDGSDWDYQNFTPGFPIPGLGDCLAMDTSTSAGQWMNMGCTAKLPVACIRDQSASPEPTCAPGLTEEGKLLTSPGFPFSASMPCDYYLSADEGKAVELEITFLEANPCCDFLIIHEGFLGGQMIANITGEVRNVTYTSTSNMMRVGWEPNGGVNVRGLAMTFRGV